MALMSPLSRASEFARAHLGKRFLLYAAVSGVATIITQVVLATLHGVVGWRASVSNIIAVCVATPVSYYMNRAWVWGKRGRSKIGKEVAPFWAFSIAGLFLSTLLVGLVAVWQDLPTGQKPTVFQQLQINAANVVGFAILWAAQFFVLDKISFKPHHLPSIIHHADDDDGAVAAHGIAAALVDTDDVDSEAVAAMGTDEPGRR